MNRLDRTNRCIRRFFVGMQQGGDSCLVDRKALDTLVPHAPVPPSLEQWCLNITQSQLASTALSGAFVHTEHLHIHGRQGVQRMEARNL
jgi:hypothetical protein